MTIYNYLKRLQIEKSETIIRCHYYKQADQSIWIEYQYQADLDLWTKRIFLFYEDIDRKIMISDLYITKTQIDKDLSKAFTLKTDISIKNEFNYIAKMKIDHGHITLIQDPSK